MKILKHLFVIFLFLTSPALSDENETNAVLNQISLESSVKILLDSVMVRGIEPIAYEEISNMILSGKGQYLNEGLVEHDIDSLNDFFQRRGWWKTHVVASVDSSFNGYVILSFDVFKGNPIIFGRFSIDSEEQIPDFLSVSGIEFTGDNFSSQILDQIINDIISQFTANGYPDIALRPSLSAKEDTVDVFLTLLPGQQATIDSIGIFGLSRTKDHTIRRELSNLYGQKANQNTLASAADTIKRIDFIQLRNEPYIAYSRDGKCILAINLNEGRQGAFDGVLGYQPSSGDESGELIGKIDLVFPNILGTGRSSHLRWENLGKNSEDIEFIYTEPWILGYPYNLSGSFIQEQRENLDYTKTIIQTSITRTFGRLNSKGGYRYEKVSSDSLNSSSAHGIDISISWDGIDNPVNPRNGILYSIGWSGVIKKRRFSTEGSNGIKRFELNFDHYLPMMSRQALAVLIRYRRVDAQSDKLSLSDRYWLGGSTSIRGYREKIFPAVKALWATLEYRLIRSGSSRIFTFIDTGYLTNETFNAKGHSTKKKINRTGYGFGIRIESRAGTLGFDFGLGSGDNIGEGKLHVSLSNSF